MSFKEKLDPENIEEKISLETLKNSWAFLILTTIFGLALWLRYLPEQGMQYLQALDPYMIYRHSQHLALEGTLPQTGFMRYFPYNAPTYILNQGNLIFPAIFYWMGPFLFFENFLEWAQFYPALMGAIGVLFAYLLGKELYDKVTGLSAAFFLATIAGVMHRTSAGFFEKEPIGTMFMMASLYLFTRSWKRKENMSGILAGLSLGFFTISWGGSQMLWMLYPMTIGLVLMLNEDIEQLITAYTPTVVVAAGVASSFNPSRFWFTDSLALINMGMLGLLWSRYLLEELEILTDRQLGYYVPSVSVIGLIGVLLSPLYSQFIADKFLGLINKASQSGGGVIAGTVAENQAAGFSQVIGNLGTGSAQGLLSQLGIGPLASLGNLVGPVQLSIIGTAFLGTSVLLMGCRKYGLSRESIGRKEYIAAFVAVYSAWSIFFISFFEGFAVSGAVISAGLIVAFLLMRKYLDGDSLFNLESMILIFITLTQLMMVSGNLGAARVTIAPTLAVVGVLGILYSFEQLEGQISIEMNWYMMLPLLWILTNLMSALARSRLMTLAAFPVAIGAGIGAAKILRGINSIDLTEHLDTNTDTFKIALIALTVLVIAVPNVASGYTSSQNIGGSPNSLWMQNLDYMEENTPEGSTILSWWDYGYHFQSIGRRASVADGSNNGYYSNVEKVNFPLADFLASSNPENHTEFLEKHSVDYIVLDETMIGKYSAVSQIHNRDNSEFNSMLQVSTSQDITQSLYEDGNETIAQVSRGNLELFVPVDLSSNSQNIDISGAPTVRTGSGTRSVDCVLTEDGRQTYDVENPVELQGFGEVCIAENPFFSLERSIGTAQSPQIAAQPARLVIIPKEISESTLVKLYLQNGHGVDFAEPVPEGSNGYVRMWEVDLE